MLYTWLKKSCYSGAQCALEHKFEFCRQARRKLPVVSVGTGTNSCSN